MRLLGTLICDVQEPLRDVYQEMRFYPEGEKKAAQELSVSLAHWQIDFVKPQGEAVKRVIRLLKFWKKEREVDIRSYTLELLTIHEARAMGWAVGTNDLFRKVLTLLAHCRSIRVAFSDNYRSADYMRRSVGSPQGTMDV
ncbi:2'-5'-oligoadenylate synthase 2-like [Babylonia areolata]|uniref:2'-5'-oligoadenylate synthase 2-like n=1 Tax=Babylonia areolata TaxID=304850 RepID=UPI003FD62287